MEFNLSVSLDLHTEEAQAKVLEAVKAALKDVTISVAKDGIENSPYLTGHNRRSIMYQTGEDVGQRVDNGNDNVPFTDNAPEKLTDMESAVYSTSGYGGYLETGTTKSAARPYIGPAAEERFTEGEMAARIKEKLGE